MSDAVTDNPHTPLAVPVRIMPSQQKLLEQLHYLTTFHNSMVILAGPEGAGKSTLLEVFLEQASDYANLAYLAATPRLTIESVRERLFQQISTETRALPNASLSKTIRRALPDEPQHLMLVVDDAHTLAPAIIDELQELALHSRFTGGKHRISVIISGTTDWAARQHKSLPSDSTDKPEIVLIPELEDAEALAFAKALLIGHEKGKALAMDNFRIQATIGTSLLYPGIIQSQLQELVSPIPAARYKITDDDVVLSSRKTDKKSAATSEPKPRRNGMKLFAIMSVVALLIATTATAWLNKDLLAAEYERYVNTRDGNTVKETSTEKVEPLTVEPEQEVTVQAEVEPEEPAVLEENPKQAHEGQVVMNYDEALPRLTEAARNFESTREIDLKLIAEPTKPETQTEQPEPVASVSEEPTEESSNNPWLNSYDNAYFLSAPPSQVVLQLGAVSSQAALNRFMSHVEGEQLKVYHTLKNERSWYVIVTGNYTSLNEARAAVATLTSDIQALQPWAKPVEWIQNELAVVVTE